MVFTDPHGQLYANYYVPIYGRFESGIKRCNKSLRTYHSVFSGLDKEAMSGKPMGYLRKGWTVESSSVRTTPLDTEGRDTVVKAARAAQSVKKSNN